MNSNSPIPLFGKYILLVKGINYNEGADIVTYNIEVSNRKNVDFMQMFLIIIVLILFFW